MQKIKRAEITLIWKKLIAHVFVVHKLFAKEFSKKQMMKLFIQSLEINVEKDNVDSWYFCASLQVWVFLKKRFRVLDLLNLGAEINLMKIDVQKRLNFQMYSMPQKLNISFQIGHFLDFIHVCHYVEIKIENWAHIIIFLWWENLMIFWFSVSLFLLQFRSIMIIERIRFMLFALILK